MDGRKKALWKEGGRRKKSAWSKIIAQSRKKIWKNEMLCPTRHALCLVGTYLTYIKINFILALYKILHFFPKYETLSKHKTVINLCGKKVDTHGSQNRHTVYA